MRICLLIVLALLAPALCAEVMVGKPAPDFKVDGDCVNVPEYRTLKDCLGEVILIADWHVRDQNTQKLAKTVQALWDKYRNKGLHVFMTHRLNLERLESVTDYCVKNNFTFCSPICSFGETNDFDAYFVKDKFHITLIGIDGNVLFYNTVGQWQNLLASELKKVVYPGLRRQSVAKPLEAAATQFGLGFYGKAIKAADAKLAGELDEAAREDAEYIIMMAGKVYDHKAERISHFKFIKRYIEMFEVYEDVIKAFKEDDIAVEAAEEVKKLKQDKAIKDEMKAEEALNKIVDQLRQQSKPKTQRVNTLRAFAKGYPNTQAGKDAEAMATRLEQSEY